jgi:hypothetical protein
MVVDWGSVLLGAALGLPVEIVGHWCWDQYKKWRKVSETNRKYSFLARRYTNMRNGTIPTEGTIEITQNKDGTFAVTGFNPDGSIQWESNLIMSPDDDGVGIATYRYISGIDHGTQRVVYFPQQDVLHVAGINQSTPEHREFFHVWEPHIRRGRLLT